MKLLYIVSSDLKNIANSISIEDFEPGDVLFVHYGDELLCLIANQYCDLNNWSEHCNIIEKGTWCFKDEATKVLLASSDGIKSRTGNKDFLNHIKQVFNSSEIKALIQNALDILSFKVDTWDIQVLMRLYHSDKSSSDTIPNTPSSPVIPKLLFFHFLTADLYELFLSHFNETHSIEKSFRVVKQRYPHEFTKAIQAFKLRYPNNNIFDNVAGVSPSNYDKINPTIDEDIESIYNYIVHLGYHQTKNNEWVNDKGVILNIVISLKV